MSKELGGVVYCIFYVIKWLLVSGLTVEMDLNFKIFLICWKG